MFSELKEIVTYTHKLGFLEAVKITGTATTTDIDALASDNSVILHSTFLKVIPEFKGTFGLPNMDRLDTILSCPEYKEDATLTVGHVTRDNEKLPAYIRFENAAGDFVNEYRLMSEQIISGILPKRTFKEPVWDVTFIPQLNAIQRLKYQAAAAGNDELSFIAKTEKGDLKFYIGDHSSHAGNFVFESGVKGVLKTPRNWPLKQIQAVLSLVGEKSIRIADAGMMIITVVSGMASHDYMIPALTK